MATSKFLRTFRTTQGVPITTATIWLVPQANTYPTGALALTAHGTRDGQYYRDNVPDGEYKIYIDPAGGSSPTLYEERLWIGDQRVTTISDHFDEADSYRLKTTGIKDLNVTTAKIANDAITNEKLADDSVSASNLQDNLFDTEKIVDLAVTTAKIDSLAVTEAKIANAAVTENKIANDAVKTAKIADAQITLSKLTQAVLDRIDAAGGGTITNNPDDISIETKAGSVIGIKAPYANIGKQGTITGNVNGDARGNDANDFQFNRLNDDEVAGAANSFIAGGQNNKIHSSVKTINGFISGKGNKIIYDDQRDQLASESHISGKDNTVASWYAHAEGISCYVDGKISHAEGNTCIATGNDGHAEGNRTCIGRRYYEISVHGVDDPGLGIGNRAYIIIPDAEGDVSSFFPFNGISNVSTRYGAGAQADTKGNIYASSFTPAVWTGDVPTTPNDLTWAMHIFCIVRGAQEVEILLMKILKATYTGGAGTKVWYDSSTEPFADMSGIYSSFSPVVIVDGICSGGNGQHSEGRLNSAWGYASHVEGEGTRGWNHYSHAEGVRTKALGNASHSEGEETIASGITTHAEGKQTIASGSYSHAEGVSAVASGSGAHAEGSNSLASGSYSHSEGEETEASGIDSHSEGAFTNAVGNASHAEGGYTEANGIYSHAEGYLTVTDGLYSHAQGHITNAKGKFSSASGEESIANRNGELALANGKFSVAGDAQHCQFVSKIEKTGAGWFEFPMMERVDSSTYKGLEANKTYIGKSIIAGRQTSNSPGKAGESCGYVIDFGFETRSQYSIGSVDVGANTIDVGSSIPNDTPLLYNVVGGSAIGGLTQVLIYYVVNTSGNTIQLSLTIGGAAIDLTSAGSGTQTLMEVRKVGNTRTLVGRTFINDGDTVGDGLTTGIRIELMETYFLTMNPTFKITSLANRTIRWVANTEWVEVG